MELKFTSAVPKREHPVGCGVSLHVTRARAAHIPAANTMSRGSECKDTPEVNRGADDELRTRGLNHGVVALCLLSYIRMFASRIAAQ